jgi:hypothetical protein
VTGYLQRLVTTAAQGDAGVHPIVRPWQAGTSPAERTWLDFADEDETHAAPAEARILAGGTAPAGGTAAPAAAPVPDGPAPGHDQPRPAAGRGRVAAEPHPAPETMTPLFGAIPAPDPVGPARAARIGGVTRSPAARRSRPGPAAVHPSGPADERGTPADPARPGPRPAASQPVPAALPLFHQELRDRTGPAGSARAGAADRGDIEIHIGRIEVTAVSPPPAAPAAKAARKSISLDDYLRNGR